MDVEKFQKDPQYASDWMADARDAFQKNLDAMTDFDEKMAKLEAFNTQQAKLYKHFVAMHGKTATLEFGAPMRAETGEHDLCACEANNYAARLTQEDEAKLRIHQENQRHFKEREALERHYSAPLHTAHHEEEEECESDSDMEAEYD